MARILSSLIFFVLSPIAGIENFSISLLNESKKSNQKINPVGLLITSLFHNG